MYREILENYAKENKWVQIQPPAQMQDIKKAEEYVGHPFPDELVKLLLELNGDKWLILSTEEIIETAFNTREYLSECYEDIHNHIAFFEKIVDICRGTALLHNDIVKLSVHKIT